MKMWKLEWAFDFDGFELANHKYFTSDKDAAEAMGHLLGCIADLGLRGHLIGMEMKENDED